MRAEGLRTSEEAAAAVQDPADRGWDQSGGHGTKGMERETSTGRINLVLHDLSGGRSWMPRSLSCTTGWYLERWYLFLWTVFCGGGQG